MIVLDNIIFSLQEAGGISVFWRNLISQYQSLGVPMHFLEYPRALQNLERRKIEISVSRALPSKWHGKVFSQFTHPQIRNSGPFIFHSSYYRTSNSPGAVNVTTVHDFIVEKYPYYLSDKLRVRLNHSAIRRSDAVICVSETTRRDLFKFIPDIPESKVHVIHNGVSDKYKRLESVPLPEYSDWLLYVGGRKFYKNFDTALRVAAQSNRKLLICGAPITPIEQMRADSILPGGYKSLAYPPDEELNEIYNSVFALIYPSQAEGFGLPVLEAQRAGCPAIAMENTAPSEVGGDAVLTFPQGGEELIPDIINRLTDSNLRNEAIERGLINSARYSWSATAEAYLKLYRSLM